MESSFAMFDVSSDSEGESVSPVNDTMNSGDENNEETGIYSIHTKPYFIRRNRDDTLCIYIFDTNTHAQL